jgi:hypothetical protein
MKKGSILSRETATLYCRGSADVKPERNKLNRLGGGGVKLFEP